MAKKSDSSSKSPSFPEESKPEPPEAGKGENASALIEYYGNKSNAIRAMYGNGVPYADIARALGIRYQHVRNVLNQPQKRLIKAERDNSRKGANDERA